MGIAYVCDKLLMPNLLYPLSSVVGEALLVTLD